MIFVDTSYLLAVTLRSDALRPRAIGWSEFVEEPLITSDYVLVEFVNHLSDRNRRTVAYPIVQWILGGAKMQLVEGSKSLLERGLKLHSQRPDKDWSLTDCISFVIMQDYGVSRALTHDHHFEQAGFEALLRRDPSA